MTAKRTKAPAPKRPRRPPGRRTLLTPDVHALIINAIRAGAFDHVAAQAAGIAPGTFHEWMRRGEGLDERPATEAMAAFAKDVRAARAQARMRAENKVYLDNPLAWLRLGPGRDRAEALEPGWTEQVAVTQPEGPTEVVVRYVNDWRDE